MIDAAKVGRQIADLRKVKGLTQSQLGERLNISFQAVSKWERGETLPDVGILLDLAKVLETTVDHILNGGQRMMEYTRRVSVAQIREGIECFVHIGELLGKDNLFYIGAMEGIDQKMNMEFEKYLADPYTREAMIAEALVQNIASGAYVDLSDVQRSFQHPHWVKTVCEYAQKYGLK
ncbi:MAG: helix-turn-helix domain-containing protein [Negativibacillus sp.]